MPASPTPADPRIFRAFTLLELIVAMALFSVFAVLLFSLLASLNRSWQTAQLRLELRQNSRVILDSFRRDLQGAALPVNRAMTYPTPNSSPESANPGLQFVANPAQITASRFLNPHALFWQAPVATDRTHGSLAEVGYFVRWDLGNPQNPRAALCRFVVNPGTPQYLIFSNSPSWTPEDWLSDSLLDAVAPGFKNATNPAASFQGWLADNVIGLWIRCLDPQGNVITNTALNTALTNHAYDSRRGFRYLATAGSKSNVVTQAGFNSAGTTNQILASLPASVEIAMVLLDSRAADRLTQKPAYPASAPVTQASFWQDIHAFVAALPESVRPGARIYSDHIRLKNAN